MTTIFDQLEAAYQGGDAEAVLQRLTDHLLESGRLHEAFEARKLLLRQRLGLPLLSSEGGDSLDETTQDALESGLIESCRDIGLRLLQTGQLRDAWHYLRALGDREFVQRHLAAVEPSESNVDEFIELCLHEGMDLERGFRIMLDHYGTCNSITTFESAMYGRPRSERAVGAGQLIRHIHGELVENVRAHIARQEPATPETTDLDELIQGRPWLFADGVYHVDTTHLASVVRAARDVDDTDTLRLALSLTNYGRQLDAALQYPGEPPFEELYPMTDRALRILLGDESEAHLAVFRKRAEAVDAREETTLVIETYIDLLARSGRTNEALSEALRLLPEDVHQTGRAPSLLELAEASGDYRPLRDLSRRRQDALGFAMSLLEASSK